VNVYYTRNSYNLTYEPNGGSYVDYQTGLYGETIDVTKTEPTRVGYDFKGWYTDEALTKTAGDTVTLEDDTTLYAKWEAKTVNYTVVYMKEVYDNSTQSTHYVYDSSIKQTAKTGDVIKASDAKGLDTVPVGYTLDIDENAKSEVTIAADGSSVLKVYYKLKRYTFVFNANSRSARITDAKITVDGKVYDGNEYRIENDVLGQDIAEQWPSGTQISSASQYRMKLYGWSNPIGDSTWATKRFKVTSDMLYEGKQADDGIYFVELTSKWIRWPETITVNYYLENINGNYDRSDKYSQTFYSPQNAFSNPKEDR